MRVLIWIAEETWEACVAQAAPLLDAGSRVTLLHVAPRDVEELAGAAHAGLLGRHGHHRPERELAVISEQEASELLAAARERLGRDAELVARRGRVEREVVAASAGTDLLVLARDGAAPDGPKSLSHRTRFVVDHAICPVLLLPREPAGDRTPRLPPEPRPGKRPPPAGPGEHP